MKFLSFATAAVLFTQQQQQTAVSASLDSISDISDASYSDTSDVMPEGGTQFRHFIAMNETQTCVGDVHAEPFNNQIRGANLGGWMVLEPWITPSLFYQFLGGGVGTTAFDTYTFCEVLGAKKANQQLKKHWETWVTEEIIKEMAVSGTVNSLRLPVGDYMFKPYGPYGTYII
jgi:hypothetical protein